MRRFCGFENGLSGSGATRQRAECLMQSFSVASTFQTSICMLRAFDTYTHVSVRRHTPVILVRAKRMQVVKIEDVTF